MYVLYICIHNYKYTTHSPFGSGGRAKVDGRACTVVEKERPFVHTRTQRECVYVFVRVWGGETEHVHRRETKSVCEGERMRFEKHCQHCKKRQHIATHCNTLQHTTTHCNTLQHTATH